MSALIPDVTIRWLTLNASSNVELAMLSNVSRRWREIVVTTILDQAENSLLLSGKKKKKNLGNNNASSSLLLVPSMVRYILSQKTSIDNKMEEYCICWFHPDGIEFMKLPLDASMDDSDDDDDQVMYYSGDNHRHLSRGGENSPQAFAPSGQQSYAGSEEEGGKVRKRRSKSPSTLVTAVGTSLRRNNNTNDPSARYVNCVYQWNGYKEAIEVLTPFGYSIDFVKRIISIATSRSEEIEYAAEESKRKRIQSQNCNSSEYQQKSYAVRGATFARPEGYCLCWDKDSPKSNKNGSASYFNTQQPPSSTTMNQRERSHLIRRRNRRRRELQREVLPKVLYSAPFKGDQTNDQIGVRQPCIQFLNIDSSHAVRLFTPPFKPGPISGPITVFCVGIATEDGCFFSGLSSRFELGHLYPESARDNLIERSAICTCVDASAGPKKGFSADGHSESDDDCGGDDRSSAKQESVDSDASSCDMSVDASGSDPGLKCKCTFSGLGNVIDDDEDENSDNKMIETCRGARGPGLWHCYVAIYDGADSIIRVDGVPEDVRCKKSSKNAPASAAAYLDGLTIGADHTFDMSLCFGNGSDGEGEGAMAELAVFKGALPIADIEAIESRLMKKHGIPLPQLSPTELSTEDKNLRMAHAMLSHPPRHMAFSSSLTRIPLRYMTKHRLVSWRQNNVVTGDPIQVSRIGSKFATGDSSSEW